MRYRGKRHHRLPHVVKCSGGRSSAMMTLLAIEDDRLDPDRGDAVLFTNTGAETPGTYAFIEAIFRRCEAAEIPTFIAEFATCEERHAGAWTRVPTYRLANAHAQSAANRDGYDWRGAVYEEAVSWSGYMPNVHERSCTKHLKIETTRRFAEEWLSGAPALRARGHEGAQTRVDPDEAHARHVRAGGTLTRARLAEVRHSRGHDRRDAAPRPTPRSAQARAEPTRGHAPPTPASGRTATPST